jgi:transposase-like protein
MELKNCLLLAFFDRCSGQVVVMVEPKKLDINFISQLLRQQCRAASTLYTDGFKMYRSLKNYGYIMSMSIMLTVSSFEG